MSGYDPKRTRARNKPGPLFRGYSTDYPIGIVCTELFDGEIDKHADLGRQMKALWKDSVKNLRRHAVLIEQMDKSPGPDIRSGYERR